MFAIRLRTCTVSCSPGKQVVGGGCESAAYYLMQNNPSGNTGWNCVLNGGSTYMIAHAVCANIK